LAKGKFGAFRSGSYCFDGLYFLILLLGVDPFLSFLNYLYELLITAVTIGFAIIYNILAVGNERQNQSIFFIQSPSHFWLGSHIHPDLLRENVMAVVIVTVLTLFVVVVAQMSIMHCLLQSTKLI
jgi:hypothetical protein